MNAKLFGVISVYGLLIACGVLISVILCGREARRRALPNDIHIDMALWAVPLGVIGARAYYVAFAWDTYRANPVSALYFWEGGLAIYGAVLGGALGLFLLSRTRKVAFLTLLDVVAPVLILAQGIGRWGNYFNGEAYGSVIANAFWQFFPAAVFADGRWRMATFFYESVWDIAGFIVLWRTRKSARFSGQAFFRYLLWYGAGRMVIEGLRADSLMLGSVRVSQALSLMMCLAALCVFLVKRGRVRPLAYLPPAIGALLAGAGLICGSVWLTLAAAAIFVSTGYILQKEPKKAPL